MRSGWPAYAMDEVHDLITVLKVDKAHLQAEVDELCGSLCKMKVLREYKAECITAEAKEAQADTSRKKVAVVNTMSKSIHLPTSESVSNVHEEVMQASFKHPKGFKELQFRIHKFTGNTKEVDFDVWLEDFLEATGDCG